MSSAFEPIAKPTTRSDWVTAQLRTAIVSGEIAPGTKLRTAELAERLQVSPTPLREALQALAAEGLVLLEPQRGARVAPLDKAEGLDIYRVRLMLEPPALAAAVRAPVAPGREEAVREALEELNRATRATDFDGAGFGALNLGFHQLLIEPCGSPWLLRLTRQLGNHSMRFQILSFGLRGGSEQVVREHTELVRLVLDGDADGAEQALTRHIQATVDHVLRQASDG
jgi:GntR family transcriptional regulator, carbon starvation induced regulator